MSDLVFPAPTLVRVVDGRLGLAEALLYPELSRLETGPARPRDALRRNLRRLAAKLPFAELHRRRAAPAGPPEVRRVVVAVEPPPKSPAWREPVALRLHAVCWPHDDRTVRAYLPELGVEVIARAGDDLDRRLAAEAKLALARLAAEPTLRDLSALQRTGGLKVFADAFTPALVPPKRRIADEERAAGKKKAVLPTVAARLDGAGHEPVYEMDETVRQLAESLAGDPPRSVLLVGPSGVGKTAAVRDLVRRRRELLGGALADRPFWATSGSRLVAGMTGFGMWQERCRDVVREAHRTRAVVHLGPLVELMDVGKSEYNHVGLAGYLRPHVGRGELVAVAECTPEQLPVIEREDPHLLDVFRVLAVPEPTPEAGRRILDLAAGGRVGGEALDVLDRLHRRYATYSAYPGRPLRFLNNLLADRAADSPPSPADVRAAFGRETGLPAVLLDPAVPLDLDATRRWFAERVIGQGEAVDLVLDLLATAKAGLTRPNRPVASLLFIGPTGVGKTEMAKALAEFLFGDRGRLVRFDMSEYADPLAVARLAGAFGGEGLLTARVREQPFAVILLDEFEKAHPSLFDLLLQVLGEARLTDAAGRVADFRNAVVVLTSNLGAETFRQGGFGFSAAASGGRQPPESSARDHFTRAVEDAVRPELFNRIDRVVPFLPLGADVVRRIAARELEQVRQRDGVRYRGVRLLVDDAALDHLARDGYDPRYGARPLKRAVERQLLAPLADEVNSFDPSLALDARVVVEGGALAVAVRSRRDDDGRPVRRLGAGGDDPDVGRCRTLARLRRLARALGRTHAARQVANRLFRWERQMADARKREARGRVARPSVAQLLADAEAHADRALVDDLAALAAEAVAAEDAALVALYGGAAVPAYDAAGLERRIDDAHLRLWCRAGGGGNHDSAFLVLYSDHRESLMSLLAAYTESVRRWGGAATPPFYIRLPTAAERARAVPPVLQKGGEWLPDLRWVGPPAEGEPAEVLMVMVTTPDRPTSPPDGLLGAYLALRAPAARLRLQDDNGTHLFRGRPDARVWVETGRGERAFPAPPAGVTRRGAFDKLPVLRTYNPDAYLEEAAYRVPLRGRPLADALGDLLDQKLQATLRDLLGPEAPPDEFDDIPF